MPRTNQIAHGRLCRVTAPCLESFTWWSQVIQSFGVPCELTIVSAHRTPDRMLDYARNAHKRGIKVIIAGAGGAAHLPGMVAALTPLPTVGVPVTPVGAHLDGLDALLSIVQVGFGSSKYSGFRAVHLPPK